jgi:predicted nucleic acid-binding protein
MSVGELLDCRVEYTKENIFDFIGEVNADYIGYDETKVILLANEAMSTGVKEKDANHVACAIIGKCDYFLTTDKRLANYKTDRIKVVNPVEFIEIWEEINNV